MTTTDTAAEERAAEFVAWFADGWRAPTYQQLCQHFLPRMHPRVRLAQPLAPAGTGHDAFRSQFARLFALVPDIHAQVVSWGFRGDDVFIELALEGTIGGRPVRWEACDRLTISDGLVVERRSFFDPAPLVKAIAARPRAWSSLVAATLRVGGGKAPPGRRDRRPTGQPRPRRGDRPRLPRGDTTPRELRTALNVLRQHLDEGETAENIYQRWCEKHGWAFGNAHVVNDRIRAISTGDQVDLLVPRAAVPGLQHRPARRASPGGYMTT